MIGWFLSSSIGRTAAMVGTVIVAIGFAVLFGRRSGTRRLRNKINEASLELEREYRDAQTNIRTDRASVIDSLRRADF